MGKLFLIELCKLNGLINVRHLALQVFKKCWVLSPSVSDTVETKQTTGAILVFNKHLVRTYYNTKRTYDGYKQTLKRDRFESKF